MSSLRDRTSRFGVLAALLATFALGASTVLASSPGVDVRLSNDFPGGGYVSADDIAGLPHYTDDTLDECSRARGRQNEPALAINPRDSRVMIGSANDYCGTFNDGDDDDGAPIASGPIWLGYYRSENEGESFVSSLVPGYPGDTSSLGELAKIRTASAGDPVAAWDAEGRVFMGAESSDDPAGKRVPLDAHIRMANPRTPETARNRILRRGFNFSRGFDAAGRLDQGLAFVSYQRSLANGFLAVQARLKGEPLEEYILPVGGGFFFALPGVTSGDTWLGQRLLDAD